MKSRKTRTLILRGANADEVFDKLEFVMRQRDREITSAVFLDDTGTYMEVTYVDFGADLQEL